MTTKMYTGSCQCGRVRYEAAIDLDAAEARTREASARATALIKSRAFRLISGEADLSDIQFGPVIGHNRVCRYCGIRPFGRGHLARLGGDFYAINLATLDRALAGEIAPPLAPEHAARSDGWSSKFSSPGPARY